MWTKIVFSTWLLIIQNALGDVAEAETLDVDGLVSKCERGDVDGVTQLATEFGSKEVVEAQNRNGWSCIHLASYNGNPDLVSFLLEHDADPNQKGPDGWTPLSCATENCHLSIVKLLLADGADAKADYSQALYEMDCQTETEEEQREMARVLLQHGADPDADKPGRWLGTPYDMAIFMEHDAAMQEMDEWREEHDVLKAIARGKKNAARGGERRATWGRRG